MGKQYLGKNINMFLLIIIIISVGSLMGVTSYYNQRYQTIGNEHREQTLIMHNMSTELSITKNELAILQGKFNQTSTDVEKYDELYTEKVQQLQKTSSDLDQTLKDYEKTKADLVATTNSLKQEQTKTVQLQADVNSYKAKLSKCEDNLETCQSDLDVCEG